jgi:GntR family transcriptional regulator
MSLLSNEHPSRRLPTASRPDEVDRLIEHLQVKGRLDADSPTALYKRLQDALRSAIREGVVSAGAMIPGERELAQKLNLSRVTVRNALKALVDERLMVQRHGARTSVAERLEKPISIFTSFSEDMLARGREPGARWLLSEVGAATPSEALALGLLPATKVCRLHRLRTADNVPMAIELSIVPTEFLPSPDLVESSLYAVLQQRGYMPTRAQQRLRSDIASPVEATLLEVEAGAPILEMERRCSFDDGRVVEFTRSRYRGDMYDFLVELVRPAS